MKESYGSQATKGLDIARKLLELHLISKESMEAYQVELTQEEHEALLNIYQYLFYRTRVYVAPSKLKLANWSIEK